MNQKAPLIVVAHSAGGVLAAMAANQLVVPSESEGRRVLIVTVASPLAGMGQHNVSADGASETGFFLDLGGVIRAYPPAAEGVEVVHLRTTYPYDTVMIPSRTGHLPNEPHIGVPGAIEMDLPYELNHDQALVYAAQEFVDGSYVRWLDPSERNTQRPSGPAPAQPQVCRFPEEIQADGDPVAIPDNRHPPDPKVVDLWHGDKLPASLPAPKTYVRCRPCSCNENEQIAPWDEWLTINQRAYAHLRGATAPYPVAIIPGFHGGGLVAQNRLAAGLNLLKTGWVAALIVSGGHRRAGKNEAQYLFDLAQTLGPRRGVDPTDRIFIEPCAGTTLTNLRDGMRMLAALRLRRALLVTDAKMTGQALVFYNELEELVPRDLNCQIGRVSYLLGDTPFPRLTGKDNGCRPPLSWRNNPLGFLLPSRRPSVFWISPISFVSGVEHTALECQGGADKVTVIEPDDGDPLVDTCLPILGRKDLSCRGLSRRNYQPVD